MRKRLGKLELEVMQIIWDAGKTTVRDVWEKFYPEKKLAYTTIATVMRKLEDKGFVKHEKKDRTYIYSPLIEQEKISQGVLKEMIEGFFDGSAAKLVSTMIQSKQLTEDDLDQLEQMIIRHREERKDD